MAKGDKPVKISEELHRRVKAIADEEAFGYQSMTDLANDAIRRLLQQIGAFKDD